MLSSTSDIFFDKVEKFCRMLILQGYGFYAGLYSIMIWQ